MKLVNLLKRALVGLYTSLKRFPATIAFAAAVTAMLITISHTEQYLNQNSIETLRRITMVLALGIPLSLCIKVIFERNGIIKTVFKAASLLAGAVVLVLYYFFLLKDFSMVPLTRYIAVNTALYLGFIFIPYFYKREIFEMYVIKLFTRFFITIIYSLVLYGGLAAIIFAIKKLLAVPLSDKLYYDMFLVVAGIFAPCFFLSGIPSHDREFESDSYPRLFKILLLYIVMPLITAYSTILYIYFVKIIITRQWPMGLVSHLVLWYSVIGALVIFFISPLIGENKWVKNFIFWFTKLVLPILAMMFVSMGIRINAYGVTENRYFVVLLGLWVSGVMIYSSLAGIKRNIVFPVSLSLIAILSVFGPWSSYSVSEFSQNKRLESILVKNSMIKDGSIVKPTVDISENDKNQINRILSYFNTNHRMSDVKYLPKDFRLDNMQSLFGFAYEGSYNNSQDNISFSINAAVTGKPLDISSYDYLFDLRNFYPGENKPGGGLEARYDSQSLELRIFDQGKEIYMKNLSEFGKQIYEKYGTNNQKNIVPGDMSFVDENAKVRLKYVIFDVYGSQDKTTHTLTLNTVNFYLLVKMK